MTMSNQETQASCQKSTSKQFENKTKRLTLAPGAHARMPGVTWCANMCYCMCQAITRVCQACVWARQYSDWHLTNNSINSINVDRLSTKYWLNPHKYRLCIPKFTKYMSKKTKCHPLKKKKTLKMRSTITQLMKCVQERNLMKTMVRNMSLAHPTTDPGINLSPKPTTNTP